MSIHSPLTDPPPRTVAVVGGDTGRADGLYGDHYHLGVTSVADQQPVGLASVAVGVERLRRVAAGCPQLRFTVTGRQLCPGAPGGKPDPRPYVELFRVRPGNIQVPASWDAFAPPLPAKPLRLLVTGGRLPPAYAPFAAQLDHLCARLNPAELFGLCGDNRGLDELAARWFSECQIPFARYQCHWEQLAAPRAIVRNRHGRHYNARARLDCETRLVMAATHVVVFEPLAAGDASPCRHVIAQAKGLGRALRVLWSTAPRKGETDPMTAAPGITER